MSRARRAVLGAAAAIGAGGLLLSGCAPADGDGDTVTLTWWDFYGESDTIRGQAVEDALARYTEQNPGVEFERRNIPRSDYSRTLLQSATSGEGPDIAVAANWETASYAESGLIVDISEQVEEWGEQDEYYPVMWDLTQYEGATYGVPHFSDVYAVWYNVAQFAEAGATPPTTWDEMGETAAELSDGSTRFGLAFSAVTGSEGANAFIIRAIGAGVEPDGFDTDAGLRAAEQWRSLVADGAVSPAALNWTEDDAKNQFTSGNAAMMINSATYVAAMPSEAPDLDWAIAPMPVDAEPATLMQSDNLTIGSTTRHEDAAWDVIEWFQTPEALNEYLPARGKLPARADIAEQPQWADDPVLGVFIGELGNGWSPTGRLAGEPEFFPNVQRVVQAALSGGDLPAALSRLDGETAELLEE
jgi:multiple sugar transport system substrate-binding protein